MEKLIDTVNISDLLSTGGIFSKIASLQDQPLTWLDTTLALQLDKDYYLSHSGGKFISNAYKRLIDAEEDNIITDALSEMAKMILQKFALSWDKIYSAINTNYKPLENYDMTQTETPDITHTKNVKINTKVQNDVYGFNSSNPVPSSQTTTDGASLNNEETNKESGTRGIKKGSQAGTQGV